jgi:segregation and condensation protein B
MSLKAKLEAVIYAAEEPVTLAQLASLFAEDALAWSAEQEVLFTEASQKAEPAVDGVVAAESVTLYETPSDSTLELSELLLVVEDEDAVLQAEPVQPETIEAQQAESEASEAEIPAVKDEAATVDGEVAGVEMPAAEIAETAIAAPEVADPEVEAKRLQRQREREVRDILRGILDELIAEYASDSRGLEIREIAGGFRMGTKPEIHDAVRAFVKSLKPALKLSLPALETLAVIAYKQPVTAPEVGEIRGVDSGGVLGSLLSRKLIATAGRKQVIGRPMLYKTTKEFLLRFGLKDLNELPSMEEF